jgi:dCTP deaminase
VSILTDSEIREAMSQGALELDPFAADSLQPASYDLRLGGRALVTRSLDIDNLREQATRDAPPEIDVAREGSVSIPAGGFALVVSREKVRLSSQHAGHLGLRSYLARKGVQLLSGLQVDPGFEGYLVLSLANLSPRSVHLTYEEPIGTLEFHRLNRPVESPYSGVYRGQQLKPTIPRADADYLRTIETLSVSDLTEALGRLSDNVSTLSRDVRVFLIPIAIAVVVALVLRIV